MDGAFEISRSFSKRRKCADIAEAYAVCRELPLVPPSFARKFTRHSIGPMYHGEEEDVRLHPCHRRIFNCGQQKTLGRYDGTSRVRVSRHQHTEFHRSKLIGRNTRAKDEERLRSGDVQRQVQWRQIRAVSECTQLANMNII